MDVERQAYETTIRQLRALVEAQTQLRRAAEGMAREARRELERVAEALCPEEVDRLRQSSPEGLRALPPRQIAEMVISVIRRRLARLEAVAQIDPDEVIRLREEVERLREKVARSSAPPVPTAAERSSQAAASVKKASPPPPWVAEAMERMQPAPPEPAVPVDAWPGWAKEWRKASPNLERDLDVVLVLGDTGVPRRQDLALLLAKRWGLKPGGGGISRALTRAKGAGLLEQVVPRKEATTWRPGHLVRLTERGEDLYRLVRGSDPVESVTTLLLNRHKSPEHTVLNLAIAEMLWRAGYRVDLLPDPVEVEGGKYSPDLAAVLGDVGLYVECERYTRKSPEERGRKWELYWRATEGHFAIATFSAQATEAIRSEIEGWTRNTGKSLVLWMTDLERGQGRKGEDVWVVQERVDCQD